MKEVSLGRQLAWVAGVAALLVTVVLAVAGLHDGARVLIVSGLLVVMIIQVVGFVLIGNDSQLKAILSLLVPGYFMFALKRAGHYGLIIGSWCAGMFSVVTGTILLS